MNAATATPNPTQVLLLAKAILSDPSKWTKGAAGRDLACNEVPLYMAVSFCALGAMWRAARSLPLEYSSWRLEYAAEILMRRVGLTSVFNDAPTTTFADIHEKFDEAIALSMEASNEVPL